MDPADGGGQARAMTDATSTPGTTDAPTPPPGYRQAQRSSTDRMAGGVCGGLAEYSGVDAVLWRAGFVVVICGNVLTMPGLPKSPGAERISVDGDGRIVGLF